MGSGTTTGGSLKGKRESGKRSRDEDVMEAIVGEIGGEPETADTMMGR